MVWKVAFQEPIQEVRTLVFTSFSLSPDSLAICRQRWCKSKQLNNDLLYIKFSRYGAQ